MEGSVQEWQSQPSPVQFPFPLFNYSFTSRWSSKQTILPFHSLISRSKGIYISFIHSIGEEEEERRIIQLVWVPFPSLSCLLLLILCSHSIHGSDFSNPFWRLWFMGLTHLPNPTSAIPFSKLRLEKVFTDCSSSSLVTNPLHSFSLSL